MEKFLVENRDLQVKLDSQWQGLKEIQEQQGQQLQQLNTRVEKLEKRACGKTSMITDRGLNSQNLKKINHNFFLTVVLKEYSSVLGEIPFYQLTRMRFSSVKVKK